MQINLGVSKGYMWGTSIKAMITQDNLTRRYGSPRSWMKKPKYAEQEFKVALDIFTEERQTLVTLLNHAVLKHSYPDDKAGAAA